MPGTVRSEALPLYPVLKFKEMKCGDFLKFTLDKRSLHNRFRMEQIAIYLRLSKEDVVIFVIYT